MKNTESIQSSGEYGNLGENFPNINKERSSKEMEFMRKMGIQTCVMEILKKQGVFNNQNNVFDEGKMFAWLQEESHGEILSRFLGKVQEVEDDNTIIKFALAELGYGDMSELYNLDEIKKELAERYS